MIPQDTYTLIDLPYIRVNIERTYAWVFALGINITDFETVIAIGPAALVIERSDRR